ncbi:unnamed protein product [Phytophthora fragariaefolia]|uniref:Unnamed protein product n=1 Tax=Phytophthora fragariaefolia TaxID=1490495 RepID=A0A9W7DA02_9STRA|nr:unnamed protein product [Phytophthora fragariaefolia]
MRASLGVVHVIAAFAAISSGNVKAQSSYTVLSYYPADTCDGAPHRVDVGNSDCVSKCARQTSDWRSVQGYCDVVDYDSAVFEAFKDAAYVMIEAFNSSDCTTLVDATSLQASGSCSQVIMYVEDWGFATYAIVKEDGGTLSIRYYNDSACALPLLEPVALLDGIYTEDIDTDQATLNSSSCDANNFRWTYSAAITNGSSSASSSNSVASTSGSTSGSGTPSADLTSSSGGNTGLIVGIAAGVGVVLVITMGIFWRRRRSHRKDLSTNYHAQGSHASNQHTTTTLTGTAQERGMLGQAGLWNDDVITAKRISRRGVYIDKLLSRGAFGEVYSGTFDGSRVAVKMLPPETRGVIQNVNNFLSEAKMTAAMDHPRIIRLIGVAWNSLSDLCVVMEFMEGGDLRALLNQYQTLKHPVGIDHEKATIALHVCHALTYLHSLMPPVIHRDLKSRNILLTQQLEAKLTDFGISRERPDRTMTAGVGTSLWMAPEVMLGERYDDKADVFSFGVVLSELDVHTLPYVQVMSKNRDSDGRTLPDTILLQQVAVGKLRVEFSESSPESIVELGMACVSVDSKLRPTAAEALYRLQVVLARELAGQ